MREADKEANRILVYSFWQIKKLRMQAGAAENRTVREAVEEANKGVPEADRVPSI